MIRAELERRPLLVLSLGLILGLTLARHPINLVFLIPIPWVLRSLQARGVIVAGFFVGALIGPAAPPPLVMENHFVDTNWTVSSLPKITPYGQLCEVRHEAIGLMLTYSGPTGLCPGSVVRIAGLVQPPVEGTEQFLQSRGLVGRIKASPETLQVVREGPWIQRLGTLWRDRFLEFARENEPQDAAIATSALCFNADGMIDSSTRDALQRTGTTHIIAASGLQVLVIAQGLFWLLMLLPLPRWAQLVAVGVILTLYAIATGLHAAVIRAEVMFLIANAAYLVRREPDWLSALAASSILYLLWNPAGVYEMGFQFSAIAVCFISLFADYVKWKPGVEASLYRNARRSLRAAVISFAVVTPLVAHYFGVVSLISIPVNLVVVMAAAPVVILSMAALPLSLLWPAGGAAMLKMASPLTTYIDSVIGVFGGERAAFTFPPFSGYWLVPFYTLLLLLWRPHVRPA
jgi:ComEC/Rec2-related protein